MLVLVGNYLVSGHFSPCTGVYLLLVIARIPTVLVVLRLGQLLFLRTGEGLLSISLLIASHARCLGRSTRTRLRALATASSFLRASLRRLYSVIMVVA